MNDAEALQAGLSIGSWTSHGTLATKRPSRATKRKLDYRAKDAYFSVIVDIGKDLFIRKLPVTKIAEKYSISRKTVWRYKKRLRG